jgi:hypothetical protein
MNQLTPQEQKIVALVAQGLTNKGAEPGESNYSEAGAEEPSSGGLTDRAAREY